MRRNFWLSAGVLAVGVFAVCIFVSSSARAALPNGSYRYVKVEGRQLLVDFDMDGLYDPYLIRGVGYSPAPVYTFSSQFGWCEMCDPVYGCTHPDANLDGFVCEAWPDLAPPLFDRLDVDLDRDLTLMTDMGVNTIRTWAEVSQKLLDRAEAHGIKVIAGFWIDYDDVDFTDPVTRNRYLDEFEAYVRLYKDHKAVLFWNIGNENNYHANGQEQLAAMYSLFNEMAARAHQVEGAYFHPVSVVNGDLTHLGDPQYNSDDGHMNSLDLWGSNVYRGRSFRTLFAEFEDLSQKPLWVAEYGADAYDVNEDQENQEAQADWAGALWDQIIRNNSTSRFGILNGEGEAGALARTSGKLSFSEAEDFNTALGYLMSPVCVGATIFAFSDEWWKSGGEWNATSGSQETGGFYLPGLAPDDFFNEEWWGLFAIANNAKNPDLRFARQAVDTLEARFACVESGSYYYAGPDNGKSCDGTEACCASPYLYAEGGQCARLCRARLKLE